MSKIEELKISAGLNDNPDQEGLNLFADMVIAEYKVRAREHILGIMNTQPFGEKVEELKTNAGVGDNPDQEGLTRFAQWIIIESANVAEQYLPEFSEAPEPNVDANIDVINLVNAQMDAHFSQ
jgi:hypothetical protein